MLVATGACRCWGSRSCWSCPRSPPGRTARHGLGDSNPRSPSESWPAERPLSHDQDREDRSHGAAHEHRSPGVTLCSLWHTSPAINQALTMPTSSATLRQQPHQRHHWSRSLDEQVLTEVKKVRLLLHRGNTQRVLPSPCLYTTVSEIEGAVKPWYPRLARSQFVPGETVIEERITTRPLPFS